MKPFFTPYGALYILDQEALFNKIASLIQEEGKCEYPSVGLTGGSTPKAFYPWFVEKGAVSQSMIGNIMWMTSDERCVPLDNKESNFGNADRMMLKPLDVNSNLKHPWPTHLEPQKAAKKFNEFWNTHFSKNICFGLCLLGMGSDCHTASIFPESLLISSKETANFSCIEVPSQGWRLTITPSGLTRCKRVVMTVTGKNKARALKELLEGPFNPVERPAQIHKAYAEKVLWLVDKDAASLLNSS